MTCCDHPSPHLHHNGDETAFWLACRCGAFTDYRPTASEAWALESALTSPVRTPAASSSRQPGDYPREVV